MLRRISILACLAVATAAHAIGPGPSDNPNAGIIQSDPTNADFLAAVAATHYFNTTGTSTAGADFKVHSSALPTTIPGIGGDVGVRIWFVSQDAGYTNALAVKVGGTNETIFPNSKTLSKGSYVDLNGGAAVDPALHFFAYANIVGGTAQYVWQGPQGLNSDKATHIDISKNPVLDNASGLWFALALDDQAGGGDRDWNDLRVLVQLRPIAAPEPATLALLAGFLAIGAWLYRRQQNALA